MTAPPATPQAITEIKTTLDGRQKTFDCELLRLDAPRECVVIYRMPEDTRVEDILLPAGTVSLGYFWQHKPFNLYQWVDDSAATLALYFNICDNTRISEQEIAWRDLCVDVLLTPDLDYQVLDEEELPDDIDPALRARIDTARDELCADPAHLFAAFAARARQLLDRS